MQGALVSLRCSEGEEDKKDFIKLEKTQTSWQGWGSETVPTQPKADNPPMRRIALPPPGLNHSAHPLIVLPAPGLVRPQHVRHCSPTC